jgi:hypothetical protein
VVIGVISSGDQLTRRTRAGCVAPPELPCIGVAEKDGGGIANIIF